MKSRSESSQHPGGIPIDETRRSRRLFREQPPFQVPKAQPHQEALKEAPVEETEYREKPDTDMTGEGLQGVSSIVAIPIKREEVGVLFVNHQPKASFGPDERDALRAFAEQASRALRLVRNVRG